MNHRAPARFILGAGLTACRSLIWPGLRVLLRMAAVPLSIIVGWPSGIAAFMCLLTATNLAAHNQTGSAIPAYIPFLVSTLPA